MIKSVKVEISTAEQEKIIGELKRGRPSKRLIIVCNGLRTSSEHPATKAISQKMNEHGHTLFTFNFSDLHGMDLARQAEDIEDIIRYFEAFEEVVLIGGSLGALSITIAANRSPKIKTLITINGFFGSRQVGGPMVGKYLVFRALATMPTRARKFWQFYKQAFRPQSVSVPVLVMHSKADKLVSMQQSRDFYVQLSGPKRFRSLETSRHDLSCLTEVDTIVRMIDEWLDSI